MPDGGRKTGLKRQKLMGVHILLPQGVSEGMVPDVMLFGIMQKLHSHSLACLM